MNCEKGRPRGRLIDDGSSVRAVVRQYGLSVPEFHKKYSFLDFSGHCCCSNYLRHVRRHGVRHDQAADSLIIGRTVLAKTIRQIVLRNGFVISQTPLTSLGLILGIKVTSSEGISGVMVG
jgi:hypothetical protein